MEIFGEKIGFHWPDFPANVFSAFRRLRQDNEFTDVTLVCEDGKVVGAHKLVLISSSPFFLEILTKTKHHHPLIYMRGVKKESLLSMVDFLYNGETTVLQEDYESFLSLAGELQLKGLTESLSEDEPSSRESAGEKAIKSLGVPEQPSYGEETEMKVETSVMGLDGSFDLESLDQKVKSMMVFSNDPCAYGRRPGRARVCKVL